jgi:hypothetical protein
VTTQHNPAVLSFFRHVKDVWKLPEASISIRCDQKEIKGAIPVLGNLPGTRTSHFMRYTDLLGKRRGYEGFFRSLLCLRE